MEVKLIPIDKIRPSPFQPRETFEKEKIEELAESIKGSDLVQPILVRKKGNTYEIIAGERRWRAYQFAKLNEIPAIVRDAGDEEARELSLIENWHRVALNPNEAEYFIVKLYEDGIKTGRYESVKDMAKKTGIHRKTLEDVISAYIVREELKLEAPVTYTDISATRPLKDEPELRKQVLKLREKGKLTRDELREYSKVVKKVSEPVRKALLRENSKLTPDEALVIDTELETPEEKVRAIERVEDEIESDKVNRLVRIIKSIEKERTIELVRGKDTGDIWICPICNKKYSLIHIEPIGSHRFEEIVE